MELQDRSKIEKYIYHETELGVLLHGDCLEILPLLTEKVDLVLIDPPYGIDYQSAWRTDKTQWKPKIEGDKDLSFVPLLMELLWQQTIDNCHAYVFCRWDKWPLYNGKWKTTNMIIWDKMQHGTGDLENSFGPRHELIAFFTKGRRGFNKKRPVDIVSFPKVQPEQLSHSCEKPTGLIMYFIELSSQINDIILDSFLGSGTTAVACEKLGRRWIGIEISEAYCKIAVERIEKERAQLKLDL